MQIYNAKYNQKIEICKKIHSNDASYITCLLKGGFKSWLEEEDTIINKLEGKILCAYEKLLKDAGLAMTPENIFSPKGQEIRGRAKDLTKKQQARYVDGRLGLLVDGTGKDYAKIKKEKGGYLDALVDNICKCGVSFNTWTSKGKTDMDWTSLTGNDMKKVMQHLPDRLMFVVHNDTHDETVCV